MPLPSTLPAFGDADIPAMLADMGVRASVGGVSGIGLFEEADQILVQDETRGQVVVKVSTLTIRTSDFPSVAIGSAVVVGTVNFTVRERLREGDGALTKLLLGYGPVAPSVGEPTQNTIDGGTFTGPDSPDLDGGTF